LNVTLRLKPFSAAKLKRTAELEGGVHPFWYMGVDNTDGHLLVNGRYLRTGDRVDIYLDVVHELCHVKQWMDGRELFDYQYDYVDRPTEIEAYRYTVLEAKRLGWQGTHFGVLED